MSEETKKAGQKAEQTEQEAKAAELSDKDLDKVDGGSKFTFGNKSGGSNSL